MPGRVAALLAAGLAAAVAGGSRSASAGAAQTVSTLELSASRGGFQPSSLTLRRGETVRLVLRSLDGEHCFAVDALRIEKRVAPGRDTRFELTPERAGAFEFHCCLETGDAARVERGRLSVVD